MKLVFIFGDSAVGKMTVGQELTKRTDLRLFHNHMMIEPVLEVFQDFHGKTINRLRQVVFEEFAASGNYGLIHTFMWAFDLKEDWEYVEQIRKIFEPYGTEFYYVELIAPLEVRLERNKGESRLRAKPSKRNIEKSERILRHDSEHYRLISREGEIPYENYLRLDNTDIPAEQAAEIIKARFAL